MTPLNNAVQLRVYLKFLEKKEKEKQEAEKQKKKEEPKDASPAVGRMVQVQVRKASEQAKSEELKNERENIEKEMDEEEWTEAEIYEADTGEAHDVIQQLYSLSMNPVVFDKDAETYRHSLTPASGIQLSKEMIDTLYQGLSVYEIKMLPFHLQIPSLLVNGEFFLLQDRDIEVRIN